MFQENRGDRQLVSETLSPEELTSQITKTLQERFREFNAKHVASTNEIDQQFKQSLEEEFAHLIKGQQRLRRELQTLAINAEREILLTKREIAKMQFAQENQ